MAVARHGVMRFGIWSSENDLLEICSLPKLELKASAAWWAMAWFSTAYIEHSFTRAVKCGLPIDVWVL